MPSALLPEVSEAYDLLLSARQRFTQRELAQQLNVLHPSDLLRADSADGLQIGFILCGELLRRLEELAPIEMRIPDFLRSQRVSG